MIKGAIFDMDGLMLDTEKLLVRFWREAAKEYGYDMTVEHVHGIRSLSRQYAIPKLQAIFGEEFPFLDIRSRRIELMTAYIDEHGFEVKKGLFELLDYLRGKGIKLAVATATARDRAELYIERIGAMKYFDAVICGDMVKKGKPDPDIYLTAAAGLGLPPEECAAFEDSPNGLISASRAGCAAIMIPDLTQPDSETEPYTTAVYESLDKAIEFFEGRV